MLSINAAVRQLKKEENGLYNCICSILTDANFVTEVRPPPFGTEPRQAAAPPRVGAVTLVDHALAEMLRCARGVRPSQRLPTCDAGYGMCLRQEGPATSSRPMDMLATGASASYD